MKNALLTLLDRIPGHTVHLFIIYLYLIYLYLIYLTGFKLTIEKGKISTMKNILDSKYVTNVAGR